MKKKRLSKGAALSKIKWDEKKHKREAGGRFAHKPGSEEFKAEPFGAGKTANLQNTDVIKLHVKANPKVAGSSAAQDFAKYQDNMTVAEFKSAVGPKAQGHLTHDLKKGFITIHDPKTLPPVKKELSFSEYVVASKTSGVQGADKIKLLVPVNPKKAGTKAAADFAKYKDEMTVAEFHAAVGDKSAAQGHILHDLKKGYISVHNPAELNALRTGAKSPGQAAAEMKIGDKKIGAMTANPFASGTKNHDDFEVTAKQLGLTTLKANAAAKAAAGTTPVITATSGGKTLAKDLADDDIIETYIGNKYTVAQYKKGWTDAGHSNESATAKIQGFMDDGTIKVVPKAKTTLDSLTDDDIVINKMGNKMDVADLKKTGANDPSFKKTAENAIASGAWTVTSKSAIKAASAQTAASATHIKPTATLLPDDTVIVNGAGSKTTIGKYKSTTPAWMSKEQSLKNLQDDLDQGWWKVEGPIPPAPPPVKPVGQTVTGVVKAYDIKQISQSDELVLLSTTNPYPKPSKPQGSALDPDEMTWVKYQSFMQKSSKKMTMADYMATQAGTPAEKQASLQKMVDQGHIKVVDYKIAQAEAAAKAQAAQAAAKAAHDAQQAALKQTHALHFQQVKEVPANKWYDHTKWGNVPVVKDTANATKGYSLSTSDQQYQEMTAARKATGLSFVGHSNDAVSFYTGSGYDNLNRVMRESGYDALSPTGKGYVNRLDKLQQEIQGDLIMWRGIGSGHKGPAHNKNNIPPPTYFTDPGFASMSFNPTVSKTFSGRSDITGVGTIFRVRVPKGAKGAFVGRNSHEYEAMKDEAEVIAARGTRFNYVSTTHGVSIGGKTMTVIELEITKPDGTPYN